MEKFNNELFKTVLQKHFSENPIGRTNHHNAHIGIPWARVNQKPAWILNIWFDYMPNDVRANLETNPSPYVSRFQTIPIGKALNTSFSPYFRIRLQLRNHILTILAFENQMHYSSNWVKKQKITAIYTYIHTDLTKTWWVLKF